MRGRHFGRPFLNRPCNSSWIFDQTDHEKDIPLLRFERPDRSGDRGLADRQQRQSAIGRQSLGPRSFARRLCRRRLLRHRSRPIPA